MKNILKWLENDENFYLILVLLLLWIFINVIICL